MRRAIFAAARLPVDTARTESPRAQTTDRPCRVAPAGRRTHDGGAGMHPDPAVREPQTAGTSAGAVRATNVTSASMIERRNAAVPSSVTVPSSSNRPGVDWM